MATTQVVPGFLKDFIGYARSLSSAHSVVDYRCVVSPTSPPLPWDVTGRCKTSQIALPRGADPFSIPSCLPLALLLIRHSPMIPCRFLARLLDQAAASPEASSNPIRSDRQRRCTPEHPAGRFDQRGGAGDEEGQGEVGDGSFGASVFSNEDESSHGVGSGGSEGGYGETDWREEAAARAGLELVDSEGGEGSARGAAPPDAGSGQAVKRPRYARDSY